jgi:MFS family permease
MLRKKILSLSAEAHLWLQMRFSSSTDDKQYITSNLYSMVKQLQSILRDSKTARWVVLLCLALPMFASYFFDDIFSTISQIFDNPNLLELGWDSEDYGFYGGAYSLLCVWGGLIICGMLLDKWGARFTGTLFIGLMVAGSAIVTYALSPAFNGSVVSDFIGNTFGFDKPSLALAYVGCTLFGLGSEIAGIAVTKSIAKWFQGKEMALAMGLQLSLARLGTASAMIIAPVAIASKQNEFISLTTSNNMAEIGLYLMIIGIVSWFVFISFDKKLDTQDASAAALNKEKMGDDEKFKFSDIGKILTNKQFILIALLCVFFYVCIISFKRFSTAIVIPRFGDFDISIFNLEFKFSSIMASLLAFSPIIFTPIFGSIVDYKGKSTRLMIIGAVLVLFAHLIFAFAPEGIALCGVIGFITLGIGYSLVPAAMWPSVTKIVPQSKLGTAYSLIFWIQNIGMLLIPIVIGKVLKVTDETDMTDISRVMNAEYIFIGLACIAIGVAFLLKKSSDNHPELKLDEPNKIKEK